MEIIAIVENRNVKIQDISVIGDNADYVIKFQFDEEWDGVTKTARFERRNGKYADVVLVEDSCEIPVQILKSDYIKIGVYSEKMTTTPTEINVIASVKDRSGIPEKPHYDVYAQLLEKIDKLKGSGMDEETLKEIVSEETRKYIAENGIEIDTTEVNGMVESYIEQHKEELKGADGAPGRDGEDGTVTDEQINEAVNNYFAENPVSVGYSKWRGKKAVFLGDSITQGVTNGGGNDIDSWIKYLSDSIEFSNCENLGTDGATITWRDSVVENTPNKNIITQLNNIQTENPDIIFIMGGTNDFGLSSAVGDWYSYSGTVEKSKRTMNTDIRTYRGALNYICQQLYEKYPNARHVFITPIHRAYFKWAPTIDESVYHNGYLEDFVNDIIDCGNRFSIPVINVFEWSGLYPQDAYNSWLYFNTGVDQLHPNADGYKQLGLTVANQLEQIALPKKNVAVFGNVSFKETSVSIDKNSSAMITYSSDAKPSFTQNPIIECDIDGVTISDVQSIATYGYTNRTAKVNVSDTVSKTSGKITLRQKYTSKVAELPIAINVDSQPTTIDCTGLTLNNTALTFTDKNTQTITATVEPTDTTDTLTWLSSDTNVATVSNGVVTPQTNGICTITATCGTKTATCEITVNVQSEDSDDTEKTYSLKANEYGASLDYIAVDNFIANQTSETLNNIIYANTNENRASILIRSNKEFTASSNFSKKSSVAYIDGMYYFCARNSGYALSETTITTVTGKGTFSIFKGIDNGWVEVTE